MSTRIRFRADSPCLADVSSLVARGQGARLMSVYDPTMPPAQPGDCWRIRWSVQGMTAGPVSGYAIACPRCFRVHFWCSALNCRSRQVLPSGSAVCEHTNIGSCWQWSGQPEDGTLTANPSLYSVAEKGGCGWHGWLSQGVMTP